MTTAFPGAFTRTAHDARVAVREGIRAAGVTALWATHLAGVVETAALKLGVRPLPVTPGEPVVLVHGYASNTATFLRLHRSLRALGFTVHTLDYVPVATSIDALAARVNETAERALAASQAEHVHLVGHSLGGVLVRHAATYGSIRDRVGTAVCLAGPHRGSPLADLGHFGRVSAQLRTSSPLLAQLDHDAQDAPARWVSVFGTSDLIVPQWSARLGGSDHGHALDCEISDIGHLGVLLDPRATRAIVGQLLLGEVADGALDAAVAANYLQV